MTQWERIRRLLDEVLPSNAFQRERVPRVSSLEEFLARVPFTTKRDLAEDQAAHPPYGRNLTYPLERYTRFHQTSGTTGQPLRWLDTPESWSWVVDCWVRVFEAAGVTAHDRIYFPFSFGPFLGFWSAFDAATRIGALAIPGGGLSSAGRLRMILDNRATVLCATPTYALRLAEVAASEGIDLRQSAVRRILVAGEPGGSIPGTRAAVESAWPGARVFDHHGMTETGPVSYECPARPCVLHIMESEFFPEVIDGELVLTNLGRTASPLIRYRTGDRVQASRQPCICGSSEMALEGGILARADEMVVVRGVNLFPGAVEDVVRSVEAVREFRVELDTAAKLVEMRIEIEPAPGADAAATARRVQSAMAAAFALRVPVKAVQSLPRFEAKSRRWIRKF